MKCSFGGLTLNENKKAVTERNSRAALTAAAAVSAPPEVDVKTSTVGCGLTYRKKLKKSSNRREKKTPKQRVLSSHIDRGACSSLPPQSLLLFVVVDLQRRTSGSGMELEAP
ncbi:Hypothetical protein SMAX5B_009989 [Scophthalmus maximus]|uniref:Uncharacterized protein n=1 Tax=Scophthalmus maximus TaxID=52904 RepID=A0A2U9BYX9_SCOMX|nr:Hypothetical protein SMAX5B_009989 [Scophthalmus maximus]